MVVMLEATLKYEYF